RRGSQGRGALEQLHGAAGLGTAGDFGLVDVGDVIADGARVGAGVEGQAGRGGRGRGVEVGRASCRGVGGVAGAGGGFGGQSVEGLGKGRGQGEESVGGVVGDGRGGQGRGALEQLHGGARVGGAGDPRLGEFGDVIAEDARIGAGVEGQAGRGGRGRGV